MKVGELNGEFIFAKLDKDGKCTWNLEAIVDKGQLFLCFCLYGTAVSVADAELATIDPGSSMVLQTMFYSVEQSLLDTTRRLSNDCARNDGIPQAKEKDVHKQRARALFASGAVLDLAFASFGP